MADGSNIERGTKIIAAALSIAGAAMYLCGYLVLRVRMNVLGIPADVSGLDERYLFAGANFIVYVVLALNRLLRIVVVLVAVAAIPLALAWWVALNRSRRARLSMWSKRMWPRVGLVAALGAIGLSFTMIGMAEPWWSDHDLLFAPQLSERAAMIAGTDESTSWLFMEYLAASVAAGVGAAIAIRAGVRRSVLFVAFGALGLQLLSLPMLYGALSADTFQPKVQLTDGSTGWIVWEGPASMTMFIDSGRPTLIRRSKQDSQSPLTIVGFERILHRLVVVPRAHGEGGS
jgi:hypothetical protein